MSQIVRARFRRLHLLVVACLLALGPAASAAADSPADIASLYASQVDKRLTLPEEEVLRYGAMALQMLEQANIQLDRAQYLLLVDRSPQVQAALLLWIAPQAAPVLLGASPVSTGRVDEYEYFETPTGVFEHTTANPDFRAEGTVNDLGVRGLGAPGMRVFDFGWQQARRGWGDGSPFSPMRLLLHATDPDFLEPRLGSVQSKGCIRIPAALNLLLDHYGLLDADYAKALAEGRSFWALPPEHITVSGAGRYLIVVDSARTERPDWSPAPFHPHRGPATGPESTPP
jgi:hypothetical protein